MYVDDYVAELPLNEFLFNELYIFDEKLGKGITSSSYFININRIYLGVVNDVFRIIHKSGLIQVVKIIKKTNRVQVK